MHIIGMDFYSVVADMLYPKCEISPQQTLRIARTLLICYTTPGDLERWFQ